MASTAANAARLAGAADLKGRILDGDGFAKTRLRQVLFAIEQAPDVGERRFALEGPAGGWRGAKPCLPASVSAAVA